MLGIAIRFELGRYHATPWGSHVNDAAVEWPPSPWRILRALYAVSRSNLTAAMHGSAIEAVLGRLADLRPVYELPPATAAHTRHYVPSRLYSPSNRGETDKILDGFYVLDPCADLVAWWDAELSRVELAGMEAAVAGLGYLGRSESVCSARLIAAGEPGELAAVPAVAAAAGGSAELVQLLCPEAGAGLEPLLISVTELRRKRLSAPPGVVPVDYAVRASAQMTESRAPRERPTLASFRIRGGARPGIREAVAIADAVRAALQAQYGQRTEMQASHVFSGRAGDTPRIDQHRHAHYLATSDDNRRVDHAVVWAPEGFGGEEVAALAGLRQVRIRGVPDPLRVALVALGHPERMCMPDLLGRATRWRSLTPFGLTRHPKFRGDRLVDGPIDQVRRELTLRSFPAPIKIELIKGPWLEYRRSRPRRSRLEASQVVGARIVFSEPVLGPIALGALSHFGLGLFVPER